MGEQEAIDLGREAISTGLWVSAPVLIAGLVIGLIIGVIQAMTQVQDQTVGFTPKILLMIVCLSLFLPWLASRMVDYSEKQFGTVPESLQSADSEWSAETKWR